MEETEKLYETIIVTFTETITSIDKMFEDDAINWGVSNLKAWIDSYESCRYTRIDEHTAIITSEYNMKCLQEGLMSYFASIITIKNLD